MDRKTVAAEVLEIVRVQNGQSDIEITEDTSFKKELGFDSLDAVEIVMAVEDSFEININDEDAEKVGDGTVGDLIDLIHKIRAEGEEDAG